MLHGKIINFCLLLSHFLFSHNFHFFLTRVRDEKRSLHTHSIYFAEHDVCNDFSPTRSHTFGFDSLLLFTKYLWCMYVIHFNASHRWVKKFILAVSATKFILRIQVMQVIIKLRNLVIPFLAHGMSLKWKEFLRFIFSCCDVIWNTKTPEIEKV